MIEQVAIVGGTHGNEFTGVYLINKWQQQPQLIQRPSFKADTLLANVKAYEHNRRYLDCDLNRQFRQDSLQDDSLTNHEQSLAKVINQQLGPKGDSRTDFIIDLHTTTSNMGPTLILPQRGKIFRQLAAYVHERMPESIIFCDDQGMDIKDHYFLSSIAKMSVLIEVGPVPQSVLRHDVYEQSQQMTHLILDFIDLHNTNKLPTLLSSVPAYCFVKSIKLPLNSAGERTAMVHHHVQDSDFKPLFKGDPLFRTFDGEDILYEDDETVYPVFINEAAYYDNDLAMSLMSKLEWVV